MVNVGKTKTLDSKGNAEQFNGREAETATFFSRCLFIFSGLGGGFRPRHLSRSTSFLL